MLTLILAGGTEARFNSSRLLGRNYDATAAPDNKPILVKFQCTLLSVPVIDDKSGEIELEIMVAEWTFSFYSNHKIG